MKISSNNKQNNNKHWEIDDFGERHTIDVKMGSTSRESMQIFVDGQHIDTIVYSGKSIIPNMEYKFVCGNENLVLVLHGNTVDIVCRGRFLNCKTEYEKQKLPVIFNVLIAILSLSAIAEFWFLSPMFGSPQNATTYVIAFAMICIISLIAIGKATSPFLSKNKKIIFSLLLVLWSWVLTFLIILFL